MWNHIVYMLQRGNCHFLLRYLVACLLACMIAPAFATLPFGELRFEKVTKAKGLDAVASYTMIQDDKGYMWFGTQSGLVRFDGFHSKIYHSNGSKPDSLINDLVTALYIDKQHRLWIGTEVGICMYDALQDKFVRYPIPSSEEAIPPDPYIAHIAEDESGNLWLATDYGLIHFFPAQNKAQLLRLKPDIKTYSSANYVLAMAQDEQGNLWLGGVAGLFYLPTNSNTLQPFRLDSDTQPNPEHNSITSLRIDEKKALWIGTQSGLEVWQTATPQLERHRFDTIAAGPGVEKNGASSATISDILQDTHGDMWIATMGNGLLYWDRQTGKFHNYRHDQFEQHSLAFNDINKLYQDRTGTLWLGTPVNGISKVELSSGDFKQISQNNRIGKNLNSNTIFGVFNAPDGCVWLTTIMGGIYSYNPKTDALLRIDNNKFATHNHKFSDSVAADGPDKFWIQSESGIAHFNAVKREFMEELPASGAPESAGIVGITSDHAGNLWVLALAGLYRFNKEEKAWQFYPNPPNSDGRAGADFFMAALEGRHGNLWVATKNNVQSFDPATGKFTTIADYPGSVFGINQVTQVVLFEDSKNNLWAAGNDGIRRMELVNGRVVKTQNFSTTAIVDAVLEDSSGQIWISTDDGILRVDPITSEVKRFTLSDGESDEAYMLGSALRGTDGTFYFGGSHGLIAFRPDDMRKSTRPPPPVAITDFQLFNKSIAIGQKGDSKNALATALSTHAITLSYRDSVFSIEFAALDFQNSDLVNYAYKLDGFDKDWVATNASRRVATYTNLDPGNYVFHVKAANSDGVWNQTGAQIAITITPPYWKTWWFRLLIFTLLVIALCTAYRLRILALLRLSEELEQEVRHRTLEISQQKNVIEEKNLQLKKINQIQEEHHSELTHFLAVASHDLRQPIHALNIYLGALTESDLAESDRIIFNKMLGCVQTMDEMFLALLDLSLLEAHAVKPRIEYFSIASILNCIEIEFGPQAQAAGLTLSVDQCHEWIESDANLIRQILSNLTANAVRYTKQGSISVRCEQKGSWLRVAVQDTGIGISASQQSIVFEKFHQLDNADREKAKGIGLGLAIVKRLCELLDLPLGLSSTPGQGSIFSIDLPLSPNRSRNAPTTATPGQMLSQISLRNALVVVVDDDEIILDATRKLLENWGCIVTTAMSARDAIDMLGTSSRAPDLLICDYRLHVNENGIDTITMLQNEFNREIPALLITGDTSSDIIHNLPASNIQVMHKPLRTELLRDTLVRLLYPDTVDLQETPEDQAAGDETLLK